MIDEKKLIDIIAKNCYPVQYDRNSVEHGMTLTGIMQAIEEQPKMDELEIAKKYIEHYKDERSMEIRYRIVEQPKAGEWIPCKDGKNMPPERESIFAKLKGTDKWHDGMFERVSDNLDVTVEYDDGTRIVKTMYTIDGEWKHQGFTKPKVIAWRPKPEPYKEGDQGE